MKKSILCILLSAAAILSLAACGSSAGSSTSAAAETTGAAASGTASADTAAAAKASGDKVEIKVFSNLPDRTTGQGFVEQTLFDQYMKENPNVTIKIEALDDESYKTKFKAYASGTDMPDLVNVWGQPSFLSEVIDAGLLAELNEDDYKDYGFKEGTLEGFKKNSKLYGLARNTDVMGFYYNKKIFSDSGITVPETYEELISDVKILKEKGYIPIAFDGADKWPMSIYINDLYQKIAGADTYAEVSKSVQTGDYSGEAWSKAADLAKEAIDAGAFQTGFETSDYGTSMNLFSNGQAAMFYMGSWEMSMASNKDISEEVRNNLGAFTMPVVDGGAGKATDICAWNGGGYSVTANSKVKDEAVKLLNYMFKPDNWTKLCWVNGVCMSAQDFKAYLTGKETSLQTDWVNAVNTSTSLSGVTFNDLGTNEFKTASEDASIEFAIGSLTKEQFFQKLTEVVKK